MLQKVLTGTGKPRRMLVVLPSWLGDTVMATPALRSLREEFGETRISYLGRSCPLAVLRESPWADEFIEAPAGNGFGQGAGFLRTVKRLAQGRFDCAVLMSNSFGSALMVTLARIEWRVGYDRDGRGMLLTDRLLPAKENGRFVPGPMIRYYLGLAGYLGAREMETKMELFTSAADEQRVDGLLAEWAIGRTGGLMLVHPGGGFGPAKRWPAERYAEVADKLGERFGLEVLISGGPGEGEVVQAVLKAMKRGARNLAAENLSIGEFKAVVGHSRLLIGNDTGPRHIAAALGVPVVTIFGPTDPAWTDTFFEGERVVRTKVSCGPCQKKKCKQEDHRCMQLIRAGMVLSAAEELLDCRARVKG